MQCVARMRTCATYAELVAQRVYVLCALRVYAFVYALHALHATCSVDSAPNPCLTTWKCMCMHRDDPLENFVSIWRIFLACVICAASTAVYARGSIRTHAEFAQSMCVKRSLAPVLTCCTCADMLHAAHIHPLQTQPYCRCMTVVFLVVSHDFLRFDTFSGG